MTTWIEFVPTVLVAIAVIVGPGAAVALSLRLRGWHAAALAAPLSVSLIVVASVLGGWFSIRWSIAPVVGLTAIACLAGWGWSRYISRDQRRSVRWRLPSWASLAAIAIPGLVISFILLRAIQSPELFSQRYDNFFHLNATQYVLQTANASPFWLGTMTSNESLAFYPSGWHALVSLVAQCSGASVVASTNATIVIVAALVWPLSAVYLVRVLMGGGRAVTIGAGILSSAFPAFPYLPLHYGTLYPLFLGLAIAPVGIGLLIRLVRPGKLGGRFDTGLVLLLTIPGIAVAHPGALLGVIALGFAAVVVSAVVAFRRAVTAQRRVTIASSLAGIVVIGIGIWRVVRPPADQIYWPTTGSFAQAIGDVVMAAPYGYPAAWLVAALTLTGTVVALVHPTLGRATALGMALAGSGLYIVVAGSPSELVRAWLTGPWYNNAPRLASIWVIAVIPLTALGAMWIVRRVSRLARSRRARIAIGMAAIALGVLGAQGAAMDQAKADIAYTYGDGHGAGPILSQGEFDLMMRLGDLVPAEAVIAVNPWNGSGFAWGISGREVLMPHVLMDTPADVAVINDALDGDAVSSELCAAILENNVQFALEFDGGDFMDHPAATFAGLDNLSSSDNVSLVAEEPGARLFEITACEAPK
ncbi:hypothetical protein GCM10009860_07420 [Microbacterium mitrae]|uniref:Uncharacterized protein n=1 Tax=Microbacterium mitrae TaxID=664640 RepID=A0A5C8HSJ6_9MICO|nr:DUF6541 family protein [Microbacterium mitrae]TXK06108.1 hypothetical protein FVP60_03840 [Microbacterium mitrae]